MLQNIGMKCPKRNSTSFIKNGHCRGKQCYQCRIYSRQFVESYVSKSYSSEFRQLYLKMSLNGMGCRGIERVLAVHHTIKFVSSLALLAVNITCLITVAY